MFVNSYNGKSFCKTSSVINSFYSGQQVFSNISLIFVSKSGAYPGEAPYGC
jgi:hypothetical protein